MGGTGAKPPGFDAAGEACSEVLAAAEAAWNAEQNVFRDRVKGELLATAHLLGSYKRDCGALYSAGEQAMKESADAAVAKAFPYIIVKMTKLLKAVRAYGDVLAGIADMATDIEGMAKNMRIFLGFCHWVYVTYDLIPASPPDRTKDIKARAVSRLQANGVLHDLPAEVQESLVG
eukprot:15482965-Alexandrium_andersonii.AAC.2